MKSCFYFSVLSLYYEISIHINRTWRCASWYSIYKDWHPQKCYRQKPTLRACEYILIILCREADLPQITLFLFNAFNYIFSKPGFLKAVARIPGIPILLLVQRYGKSGRIPNVFGFFWFPDFRFEAFQLEKSL